MDYLPTFRDRKNIVSRGCLLLIALMVLNSCKQIFLDDADYKIIEESNRLMRQERQRLEEQQYAILYEMNARATNIGYQSKIELVHHGLLFREEYKTWAKKIDDFPGKYPRDLADSIRLSIEDAQFFNERLETEIRFEDQLYFNSTQLNLDLAWKTNKKLSELIYWVGLVDRFSSGPRPFILSSDKEVRLLIPNDQTGDFLREVSYSIDLKDSIEIKDLPPWVRTEYAATTKFIKVIYQNKKGNLIEVEFDEITQLEIN